MDLIALGNGGAGGGGGIESKYDFLTVPFTEPEADANNVVGEFTGGANANETVVGGNLGGGDLVMTQFGSIPAAANGGRLFPSAFSGFHVTLGFINYMATSPAGFSVMWRMSEVNYRSGRTQISSLSSADASSFNCPAPYTYDMFSITSGAPSLTKYADDVQMSCGLGNKDSAKLYPANTDVLLLASLDLQKRVLFCGLSHDVSKAPTQLSDFVAFALSDLEDGTTFPVLNAMRAVWGCNSNGNKAVIFGGYGGSISDAIDARALSFTMTNYPCVVKK